MTQFFDVLCGAAAVCPWLHTAYKYGREKERQEQKHDGYYKLAQYIVGKSKGLLDMRKFCGPDVEIMASSFWTIGEHRVRITLTEDTATECERKDA
jgi:hypothetical protein